MRGGNLPFIQSVSVLLLIWGEQLTSLDMTVVKDAPNMALGPRQLLQLVLS